MTEAEITAAPGAKVDAETWEEGFEARSAGRAAYRSGWTRSYHEMLLLDRIYPRLMPDLQGRRLVEVGSAPGRHLVHLHRLFGVRPFGVELTESGAELNRQVFSQAGIDPAQVIRADFFDQDFQEDHHRDFDVVLSRGFLEHFDDPAAVVDLHLNLLRPGGHLVVIIPNLRGVFGAWQRRFHPELLARHNLETMRADVFGSLFERADLRRLYCGHYGTFDTWALSASPESSRFLHGCVHQLRRAQIPLNVGMRLLFGRRGFETATFSPFLLFIGVYEP